MAAPVRIALLALAIGAAGGEPADGPRRVLPPAAAGRLERAFGRAGGRLTLRQASIDRDRVDATVCDAHPPGTCYRLRLDDPQQECDGRVTGPWCLRFPGEAPPKRLVRALAEALASDRDEAFWITVAPEPDQASPGPDQASPGPDQASPGPGLVALLALVTLVVPALAGWAAGRLLRWLRRRRLTTCWSAAACVLVPAAASLLAALRLVPLGFWDLFVVGLLAGAGFLLAAHRVAAGVGWRHLVLGAGALLVALVVVEIGSRLLLPAPPVFAHALRSPIVLHGEQRFGQDLDAVLGGLFPAEHPAVFEERTRGSLGARARVLHVGDSMVRGSGLPLEQAFPAVLDRMDPQADHVNAGIPGVGPDYYLVLIERWLARLEVDQVVVYLFEDNDFFDLDASYFFCHDGPLLSYGPQGPQARCDRPNLDEAAMWPSPYAVPPYSLRVAASCSVFARHLWGQIKRLSRPARASNDVRGWRHFRAVLQAIRDRLATRSIGLVVVFLPSRRDLEQLQERTDPQKRKVAERMRSETRALGIAVLDPWELFAGQVRRHGSRRLFLNVYPGDIHFSPEGHRLLAGWLHHRLRVPPGGS